MRSIFVRVEPTVSPVHEANILASEAVLLGTIVTPVKVVEKGP
jgi:hypothetical protein